MENIGDIDSDGYTDIAVSAPYVGDGVVYIFRGAGDHLVPNDYQVGGHVTAFCNTSLSLSLSLSFSLSCLLNSEDQKNK